MTTHYALEGELWSGCVHMQPITRETARRMIRRYGAKTVNRRGCQWADFPLATETSTLLPAGYHYRNIRVGLTRDVAERAP